MPQEKRRRTYEKARLVYLPFNANGLQSVINDCLSILPTLFFAVVLLILGVPGGSLLPFVKLFTRKKNIVSIDGLEWGRDKWNRLAKWCRRFAENLAVKYSRADISDNDAIQNYTTHTYNTRSSALEYGGDHAVWQPITREYKMKYPFLGHPYAFKVCRIEPENNVHLILEAFSELPDYPFVLVGNGNNSEFGRQLKTQFSGFANLHLLDPICNQQELDALRSNCFVYVHGHSAGSTNPSVVEAMYRGLFMLAFNVSFNMAPTEHQALYFTSKHDLKQLIRSTQFATWKEEGAKMLSIAKRRYTWQIIANKYNHLIQQACSTVRKGGVQSGLSRLGQRDLLQHPLGHYHALTMFYEEEL